MLLFTHTFPHHPTAWWLYLLTYALLAITASSVLFETSQGLSRGLSRLCALLPRLDRHAASAVIGATPTQSAALRIGKNVCRNAEHAVPVR